MTPATTRRYRILDTLGQGGFARVYHAELLGPDGYCQEVALKLVPSPRPNDPDLKRLRDEAKILAMLRHPNIVRCQGIEALDEGQACVLELVDGIDACHIVRNGGLPPRPALEFVAQVARALDYALHRPTGIDGDEMGVCHRDIKPSNLRLDPHGRAVVLDFGAAFAQFEGRESETATHEILGSPAWMAPERRAGIAGPAGDVYSLGMVLAELLVGAPRAGRRVDALPLQGPSARLVAQATDLDLVDRPTARAFADDAELLAATTAGPTLAQWARENVQRMRADLPFAPPDGLCGRILHLAQPPRLRPAPSLGPDDTLSSDTETQARPWVRRPIPDDQTAAVPRHRQPAPPTAQKAPPSASPTSTAPHPLPDQARAATHAQPSGPAQKTRLIGVDGPLPLAIMAVAFASLALTLGIMWPSAAPTGSLDIVGDVPPELWLVAGDERHSAGTVPAGTYDIQVRWEPGGPLRDAGEITISPGQQTTLRCPPNTRQCTR